jgi:hypothetical protein
MFVPLEVTMTTAVAATRRPGIRAPVSRLSTLGAWHFTYLVAVLLIFGTLFFLLLFAPLVMRYQWRLDVLAHERSFGFRLGLADGGHIRDWRIVEVTPGGRFAQAGFRAGDVPSERDSNGIQGLAWALDKAAAGQRACVTVWNEDAATRREVCLAGTP